MFHVCRQFYLQKGNQEGLELNEAHHHLLCADDVTFNGGMWHTWGDEKCIKNVGWES
jgi:hypothetical protein